MTLFEFISSSIPSPVTPCNKTFLHINLIIEFPEFIGLEITTLSNRAEVLAEFNQILLDLRGVLVCFGERYFLVFRHKGTKINPNSTSSFPKTYS